jgi:H+-translocating NAD(P) transhydrogenase subunit alpha
MVIGVLKEPSFETRVSLLPDAAGALVKKGITVLIEQGAGKKAFSNDEEYAKTGASVKPRHLVIETSDVILTIHPPAESVKNKVIIGVYQPMYNSDLMLALAKDSATVFSLDMLPRTTRAQSMDVLSSQANIAGYKAVIVAAEKYVRYFPMFMTAAGSITPAKVLVLGAGVAGLQAIATARRLGAVVEVFDTRPAVKEEVISLGGKFIEVEGAADASKAGGYAVEQSAEFQERQKQKIAESIAKADIVITTAQIPGKRAPVLIENEMISKMRKGSIIIDLAAATGGNTESTKNNESVMVDGVTIIGNSSLASTMPADASKVYGKNVLNFLSLIIDREGHLALNFDDDLVKGCCIAHNGALVHEKIKA